MKKIGTKTIQHELIEHDGSHFVRITTTTPDSGREVTWKNGSGRKNLKKKVLTRLRSAYQKEFKTVSRLVKKVVPIGPALRKLSAFEEKLVRMGNDRQKTQAVRLFAEKRRMSLDSARLHLNNLLRQYKVTQ